MTRRDFLGLSISASIAARLSTVAAWLTFASCSSASAQVSPETVLTVVQMALALASLFGKGGPGIADLLNLQAEMLKNISDQLGIIQQSIAVIFEQLEEIKILIRSLPDQVVLTLYKNKVSGLIRHYGEIMRTYAADVKNHGISYSQSKNAPEIEGEILRGLREARNVLFGYDSELVVPIVCAALQTESHAMIMANYPHSNIQSAFTSYKSWLSPFLSKQIPASLVDEVASLEADVIAKMENLDKLLSTYSGRTCTQDVKVRLGPNEPIHVISGRLRSLNKAVDIDDVQSRLSSEYGDLTNAGEVVIASIRDYKLYKLVSTDTPISLNTSVDQTLIDSYCPKPFGMMPEQAVGVCDGALGALKVARLKYATYKSLHLCAADAMEFIQKLSKEIESS